MTKKEQFKEWLDEQHSAGAIIADKIMREAPEKAEEIWGISEKDSVIPSNLPSEKEFIAKYEVIYGRDLTGVTKASLSILYDWLVSQVGHLTNEATKEEPAYKKIPFSMEEYKKHPDCLYLRETGAQIKELIHFNTARYSFQYAGTVNGDLHLFISGNEFFLKIPVTKVKNTMWVAVYKHDFGEYWPEVDSGFYIDEQECKESNPDADAIAKVEWEEEG